MQRYRSSTSNDDSTGSLTCKIGEIKRSLEIINCGYQMPAYTFYKYTCKVLSHQLNKLNPQGYWKQ